MSWIASIAVAIGHLWAEYHDGMGEAIAAELLVHGLWHMLQTSTNLPYMGDPSKLRVADAERERLIEELHEHAIVGRLTPEELEERIGGAYRAMTRADLDALRDDLPLSASSVQLELRRRKSGLRRRLAQETGGALAMSGLCVGVWLAADPSSGFWPGWVIGATLLPLVRDGWRLLGPGSDIEVVEARMQARRERQLARGRRRARYHGVARW
jgi:hypothetical protein